MNNLRYFFVCLRMERWFESSKFIELLTGVNLEAPLSLSSIARTFSIAKNATDDTWSPRVGKNYRSRAVGQEA